MLNNCYLNSMFLFVSYFCFVRVSTLIPSLSFSLSSFFPFFYHSSTVHVNFPSPFHVCLIPSVYVCLYTKFHFPVFHLISFLNFHIPLYPYLYIVIIHFQPTFQTHSIINPFYFYTFLKVLIYSKSIDHSLNYLLFIMVILYLFL